MPRLNLSKMQLDNPLSPRELEVLHLITLEYTTGEIASALFVSPETIKSHRRHLLIKLGARNVAGLVRRAFERGVLEVGRQLHANAQSEMMWN